MAGMIDDRQQPVNQGMTDDRTPPAQPQPATTWDKVKAIGGATFDATYGGAAKAAKNMISPLMPNWGQLPETGGMMAGEGALLATGAKAISPMMAPVMAVGAATGDTIKKYIDLARLAFGSNPQDIKFPSSWDESMKQYGYALLRGGTGGIINQAVNKAAAPFASSITPTIQAQNEAANRLGVKPPLRTMTDSPRVQAMERGAEYSWLGSPIVKRAQEAVKRLGDVAETISNDMGPNQSPETMGQMVSTKVKTLRDVFDNAKNSAYDAINEKLGNQPTDPKPLIDAIKEVQRQRAGGPEGRALLNDWLERIQPGYKVPGMAMEQDLPLFNTIKQVRTEIGSRGKFNDLGVTGLKAQLEGLYGAASDVLDAKATQAGMGAELDNANSVFATGIKKLQDPIIKSLQSGAEKNPSHLFEQVIQPGNPTLIKTGKEVLGNDGFAQLRKQWWDNLVSNSRVTTEGGDILSSAKVVSNLRKYEKDGVLQEIVDDNPELEQKIRDLMDVSKMMTRGSKVTKGSETGFILNMKKVGGLITGAVIRTDTGREFLTTGFPNLGKILGGTAAVESDRALQPPEAQK